MPQTASLNHCSMQMKLEKYLMRNGENVSKIYVKFFLFLELFYKDYKLKKVITIFKSHSSTLK